MNKDLWGALIEASQDKKIKWNYVGGHIGIDGNERCDEIATTFASLKKPELFFGEYKNYKFDLENTEGVKEHVEKKAKSNLPAYSYVSLVNGTFHADDVNLVPNHHYFFMQIKLGQNARKELSE